MAASSLCQEAVIGLAGKSVGLAGGLAVQPSLQKNFASPLTQITFSVSL
jgi:hypothetical protein